MSRGSRSGVRRQNSGGSKDANDGRNVITPWEMYNSVHGNVGLHKALASVKETVPNVKWIGVLDTPTDIFPSEMRRDIDEKLAMSDNITVWVKDDDFRSCYDVFCHQVGFWLLNLKFLANLNARSQVLWPSLHYALPDAPKTSVVYESSSFAQYRSINEKFAETIVANYREGDVGMCTISVIQSAREYIESHAL
jgi:trehalose 6-phosphate synthase/phosphatase